MMDGMSSDESDGEHAEIGKSYHVSRPKWRSAEVGAWLRVFDSVHLESVRERGSSHGPHIRVYNHASPRISSSKKFVPRLPINAYDTHWLEKQNEIDLSVRPSDPYNFTHDANVFK
jgi:hypothetical protein